MGTLPSTIAAPMGMGLPPEVEQGPTQAGPAPQQDFGPNNEKLPDELQNALKWLVDQYTNEDQAARREEVARIRKAHLFWKGLQNIYYSAYDDTWHFPFDSHGLTSSLGAEETDTPRYQFVTNIFQAYGLILMAVLSQDVPRVRFFPQSAQQQEDVATAQAATDVVELVERNNQPGNLLNDLAFFLFCDGKAGGYVRYLVDGDRFGSSPEDELEEAMVKVGEDAYHCPNCDGETNSEDYDRYGFCVECGEELDPVETFQPAATMSVPRIQQTIQMPRGQEVITIVGGLELKTPIYANEQREFPYLQWQSEQHKARLKAAYPHAAKKIAGGGEGANEQYERISRLNLKQGNIITGFTSRAGAEHHDYLVTYTRTWLRPWAFELLEKEDEKKKLKELFADGCYVAFAGGAYCESRNEKLDDHWRIVHAMKGDGQDRPSLGDSLTSVQERFNTLTNLQIETYEYQIPTTYVDSEVLDADSFDETTAQPGAHYFCEPRPGQSLASAFHTTQGGRVPPDFIKHTSDLYGPIAQFLTGAFPALFGGQAEGAGGKTATGYQMQRDQAMGRIGGVWRNIQEFYSQIMLLAVEEFRRNRPEDVEVPLFGKGSDFRSKWIRLADLQGHLFAYPQVQQFPTLWNQQRSVVMQLMQSPDPMIQRILGASENLEFIKGLIGLRDIAIPDLDAAQKQHREIAQLLEGVPQPQLDPFTGVEIGLIPSVPVDAEMDDHETELEIVQGWLNSEEGQKAKVETPLGWANVRAHALAHKQAMIAEQMKAALAGSLGGGAGLGAGAPPLEPPEEAGRVGASPRPRGPLPSPEAGAT